MRRAKSGLQLQTSNALWDLSAQYASVLGGGVGILGLEIFFCLKLSGFPPPLYVRNIVVLSQLLSKLKFIPVADWSVVNIAACYWVENLSGVVYFGNSVIWNFCSKIDTAIPTTLPTNSHVWFRIIVFFLFLALFHFFLSNFTVLLVFSTSSWVSPSSTYFPLPPFFYVALIILAISFSRSAPFLLSVLKILRAACPWYLSLRSTFHLLGTKISVLFKDPVRTAQ